MKYLKVLLSLAIGLTAIIGDYIVFKSRYSQSQIFRAFSDSFVHTSIGFLSSLLFFSNEINVNNFACVCNVVFCTFMSLIIDIDHVFMAKSIYLKDMTNLKRGIFHCTTFWFLISTILLLYSIVAKKLNVYLLTYMIIIAFTSHHIRDANRRGLWVYPFDHTPPIPKPFYVVLVSVLPNILAVTYKYMEPVYRHLVIEYNYQNLV